MGTQHHPVKGHVADLSGFKDRRDRVCGHEARSFKAKVATAEAMLADTADFLRHLEVRPDQKVALDAQLAAIEQVLTSRQNPAQ